MTADDDLRRAHDVVCACPADDSDPDCNWRPTITEIRAALAARSEPEKVWDPYNEEYMHLAPEPPAEGLDVERLRTALHEAGIGCKPNIPYCRATHRGHAERILAALAPEQPEGDDPIAWGSQQI